MPAARHLSRSPDIASAVIAMMRGRSLAAQRAQMARLASKPIHLRHLDVHKYDVVGGMVEPGERLASIPNDVSPISEPFQQAKRDLLVDRIIFGEKDAQRHGRAHIVRRR